MTTEHKLRRLGNSDLELTAIGFGAWAIGGGNWEFAWGAQDDEESIRAIHWIDTAAIYGLGHSEEVVARAVESSSHKPYIFTNYRSLTAKSEIEEAWEALTRFKEQGKIRWIGVSNFNVEQIKRAQAVAPVTSLGNNILD
jgi:aryl-alcohol dehydrogenase-like predicted oxidoreductase